MNLAVFGNSDGGLVCCEGPFEVADKPPASGAAIYQNDFALSSATPWKVPARVHDLPRGEAIPLPGIGKGQPAVEWDEPEVEPFAEVFGDVSQAIRAGTIEKSVPVATAKGRLKRGQALQLLARLPGSAPPLQPYAWVDGNGGFVGLSPELLFRHEEGFLHTMALAGTARREEREAFEVDDKEIREHEFVAQTLHAKLADLGETTRRPRGVMDLGRLVHFHSGFDVELAHRESLDRLIRVLHPTPALGPLPRTRETFSLLLGWRNRLNCPSAFGAPFGLWRDGVFTALVAIRMVAWNGDTLRIPSGCGVIEESRLVNEWRELRLKREAVRAAFSV